MYVVFFCFGAEGRPDRIRKKKKNLDEVSCRWTDCIEFQLACLHFTISLFFAHSFSQNRHMYRRGRFHVPGAAGGSVPHGGGGVQLLLQAWHRAAQAQDAVQK